MSDVLFTSVTGLLAFQKALSVTSNNVANVDTPGYSVERANFSPQLGFTTSVGSFGNGVSVTNVTRSYSELLAGQMRTSQSSYSGFNSYATTAASIDNVLSDTTTGLTATLQAFTNSLQTLANSPTLPASGTAVLSSAQTLAQSIQGYASQLSAADQNVEGQINSTVQEINTLAGSIATVNGQIAAANNGAQSPNSLLDQRDQLINQLSQYVSVNTAPQSDGSLEVFIGSGQTLVTGAQAQTLSAIPNQYNPTQFDVGVSNSGTTVDVTGAITGGSLGGLLAVRSQVINPTLNALGQISVGVANVVNQQQAAGLTQAGTAGQPMFAVGGVQVSNSSFNTGTAQVTATRTNLSALTTDDYKLSSSGGTWQLYDMSSQQTVAMGGDGSAGNPFTAAGLSIVVSGTPGDGDSYLVQPTAIAAANFSVQLTSPTQIASAGAVQTGAAMANTGTGTIAAATVTDPTDPALLAATHAEFQLAHAIPDQWRRAYLHVHARRGHRGQWLDDLDQRHAGRGRHLHGQQQCRQQWQQHQPVRHDRRLERQQPEWRHALIEGCGQFPGESGGRADAAGPGQCAGTAIGQHIGNRCSQQPLRRQPG